MSVHGNNGTFSIEKNLKTEWSSGTDNNVVDGDDSTAAYMYSTTGATASAQFSYKFTPDKPVVKDFFINIEFKAWTVWSDEKYRLYIYVKYKNSTTETALYDSGFFEDRTIKINETYNINAQVDYFKIYGTVKGWSVKFWLREMGVHLMQKSHLHGYKNGIIDFVKDDTNSSPLKIKYNGSFESIMLTEIGDSLDSGFRFRANNKTYAIAKFP